MRPLIIASLAIFFLETQSYALTQSLLFNVRSDSRKGPLDIADLNRRFGTSQVTEQLGYRIEGLWDTVTTQASAFISQPDYSSILIRNRSGGEEPLSNKVSGKSEVVSELTTDWSKGENSVSLGWRGSLTESPFFANSARASYTRSFFSKTSAVGIEGLYLSQAQPESYFIDRDFRTKQRPTHINAYELGLIHDQVLTENWKMRHRVSLGQRIEERPRNVTVVSKHGYAVTDRVFADLELSYAQELRSEALKNERGYFTAYGGRAGISVEVVYDLLLSISYGLLIERENDPRIERLVEVASDQYGLGLNYRLSNVELQTAGSYVVTNTGIRNFTLSGGMLWRL